MDLIDKLRKMAEEVPEMLEFINTEEATKNALIMPFIKALGYNVYDPREVVPEFTADVGTKKGEKVDYAIMQNGTPIILFECKAVGGNLTIEHSSQLYRYFTVTDARIAVLTDGITYKFYSDLEDKNRMDEHPFLVLDLLNLSDQVVSDLKKLSKSNFNLEEMLEAASEIKYSNAVKKIFADQMTEPDDDFVRYFASQIYNGMLTQRVRDEFRPIIKRALRSYLTDRLTDRLNVALAQEDINLSSAPLPEPAQDDPADSAGVAVVEEVPDDGIETTEEEWAGYWIVKTILRPHINPNLVVMRDVKSYCGILFDDNNRKPLCRLHFNSDSTKYVSFFDIEKNEEKVQVTGPDDIYDHAERLMAVALHYMETQTVELERS